MFGAVVDVVGVVLVCLVSCALFCFVYAVWCLVR